MLTEDFVSFNVAKLLKEKGFDELCIFKYNSEGVRMKAGAAIDEWQNSELDDDECSCPSQAMAMKWLREVHNIHIELNWDKGNQLYSFQIWKPGKFRPEISSLDLWKIYKDDNYLGEWIYEESVEAAIKYCLKNLI